MRLSPVVYFLFVWDFSLNLRYLIETFPIKVILLWSWRQECGFWRFCQWSPAWLGLPQSCKCQTPAWPSPCPVAMATYNLKSKISLFLKDIIWQHIKRDVFLMDIKCTCTCYRENIVYIIKYLRHTISNYCDVNDSRTMWVKKKTFHTAIVYGL